MNILDNALTIIKILGVIGGFVSVIGAWLKAVKKMKTNKIVFMKEALDSKDVKTSIKAYLIPRLEEEYFKQSTGYHLPQPRLDKVIEILKSDKSGSLSLADFARANAGGFLKYVSGSLKIEITNLEYSYFRSMYVFIVLAIVVSVFLWGSFFLLWPGNFMLKIVPLQENMLIYAVIYTVEIVMMVSIRKPYVSAKKIENKMKTN